MTHREATDLLVKEYRAEDFREFFANVVENYMGTARNVTPTDLSQIRTYINAIK